jgi:hypothetical protein
MIETYIFSIQTKWLFSPWNVVKTKNCELKYEVLEKVLINLEWLYNLWNLIWTRNCELKCIESKLWYLSISNNLYLNNCTREQFYRIETCPEFLFRIVVQDFCLEFLFRILVQNSCSGFLFRLLVQVNLS